MQGATLSVHMPLACHKCLRRVLHVPCRQPDSDNTILDASLSDWLYSVQPDIQKLREHLQQWHRMRGEHAQLCLPWTAHCKV